MAIYPILFYLVTGILLHRHLGHYHQSIAAFTAAFLVLSLIVFRYGDRVMLAGRKWGIVLSAILPIFLTRVVKNRHVAYAIESPASSAFNFILLICLALSLILFLLWCLPRAHEKWIRAISVALGLILLGAQTLVPIFSPKPVIDVWVNNTAAADYLLQGINPYSQPYADLYKGKYDYLPGFLYFPGTVLYQAPFRAIFGDIRYGFVFANLLIALGLFWLSKRRSASGAQAYLYPLLWLSFPVTFFVLEQGWTDTILIALTVLMFVLVDKKMFRLAGAAAGFAFAVKQYGFVIPAVGCVLILNRAGWKRSLEAAAVAAGVFFVVLFPFAWADWQGLYKYTILNQVGPGMRTDAYNFTVFLFNKFGILLPKGVSTAVTLAGIGGGLFYTWRGGMERAAFALFFAYAMAFFFGKWAFCNYYYLLASFLLLYLVARSSGPALNPRVADNAEAAAGTPSRGM